MFPSKLFKVEISDNDRIIRFYNEKGYLYFAIRGKYTNIFSIDVNNGIDSF
jgi:hypothetical protein